MIPDLDRAFTAYSGELRAYLCARTGDIDTAEELLGALWVEACARMPAWQERPAAAARGDALRAWLYMIAGSRAVDWWRQQRRRPRGDLERVAVDGPEERIDALDAAAIIRPHLASLPQRQLLVLRLRFWEGRSLDEVAAALGTTRGAVKALQHRALAGLAEAIAKPPTSCEIGGL